MWCPNWFFLVELTFRNTAQTKIDELSIIQIVIQIFINHDVDIDPPQKKEKKRCWHRSVAHSSWNRYLRFEKLSYLIIAAFLFKQAKDLGLYETEESKKEQQRQTKKKMLLSWLPLLCRASNGTDVPILSMSERVELERVLEESIEMLEQEEDQEQVLSLWLHHFTHCPSSDWPNLHASYTRWCNASRKLLVLQWKKELIFWIDDYYLF